MLGQGTMPNEEEVSLTSKKIHADIKKNDAWWTLLPSSAFSSRDVRWSLACLVVRAELLQGALQRRTLTFPTGRLADVKHQKSFDLSSLNSEEFRLVLVTAGAEFVA